MAVYAYLRVSTGKQDGENQRKGVDDFAKSRGFEITEYIDDEGVSGTKEPEKRELGKLMKKLKPGDILIAGEISRLGRSLFMVMRILEYCMNNDVKVYTVKDGYELGDNIQSKVLAFAFGLSAEIEREMISRRTKEALAKKREGRKGENLKTKEMIEYLQGFPETSDVDIVVLDCSGERKFAFPVERLALITGDKNPMMFLYIDREKAEDVTKGGDE